jgi:phosphotransferase system enzyme I (PtsI)
MAREVDFFSLGTNDLVQYTVAADRTNERVAGLYEPTHPAILRLIRTTVEAARAAGIWVGVCGEMGGDPYLTPLLLGLGLDEISAGAAVVPRIKYAIRHLNRAACMEWAHGLFALDTPGAVFDACEQYARSAYPELLDE